MGSTALMKYWAIALFGSILSFSLFALVIDKKVKENRVIVENAISKTELKIADELQKIHLVIESMSFFFENTPEVSQEMFEDFTNPFKESLRGIKALEWAPNITASEKKNFTTIKETDDSNRLIPATPKASYYPIALINPFQEFENILGYDLYSETTRKMAIQESISAKEMAFTGPIELVQDDNGVPGILAIKTVFEPDEEQIKGVVAVVYRMDEFLQKTLNTEMNILDLTFTDRQAGNSLLFTTLAGTSDSNDLTEGKTLSMNAANRIWDISIHPKAKFTRFPQTFESYFVLLFGLLTTALVCFNLKGRDDRSKELEKKVRLRTEELEVSNKQKENLLREVHHRVMNNLQVTSSLMNLQKRKLRDEEAIYALTSSQDRIKAIALIHQKIYQHDGADAVDLKGYLENLIISHKRMSPGVSYEISCPEVFLDLDTAVPLAIIASEIVINALKHAFPDDDESNHLNILVTTRDNNIIDIVFSDNGVGMPKNKDSKRKSGLGQDIIKKLCRQLEADYNYTTSASGTRFKLSFRPRKLQVPVFS